MKTGLIAAGSVARDCIAALHLENSLGPVAAASQRVASRIANSLRAGYPVGSLGEVAGACPLIVCVPERALPYIAAQLVQSGCDWRASVVLAYTTQRDSRDLAPLREAGASAGSIRPLNTQPQRFVIEGDRDAVRVARGIVQRARGRSIELESGFSALFNAGTTLAGAFWTPFLETAAACLRRAGAPPHEASRLAALLAENALRAHMRGGRKSWTGPIASGDEEEILQELEALQTFNGDAARCFRECTVYALESVRRHPHLARKFGRLIHS